MVLKLEHSPALKAGISNGGRVRPQTLGASKG